MNTDLKYFNEEEKKNVAAYVEALRSMLGSELGESDFQNVYRVIAEGIDAGHIKRDKYGINPVERSLCTACLVHELIAPDRNITIATLLYNLSREGFVTEEQIKDMFGSDVSKLVHGLINVSSLYKKQAAVENDNFHKLLMTFA